MYKTKFKVSIIVPTFNSEAVIKSCLNGIKNSTFTNYEIIIVDNISSDKTIEIAQKFTENIIVLEQDMERNHARNIGLKKAIGEIIVFIDSDNIMQPDSLQIIVNYFENNLDVSAVTGRPSLKHPNYDFFSQYKNLYMHYILGIMPKNVTFLQGDIYAVRACDLKEVSIETITDDTARGQQLFKDNKAIHFLKNLEVVHLKRYTFCSLIKNDFRVPFEWTKIFLKTQGWRQLGKNGVGYAHSPKEQLLSIMLAPILLLSLIMIEFVPFNGYFSLILLILWIALNYKYFKFIKKNRGFTFGVIKGFPLTLLDHLVMASGVISGLIYNSVKPNE